MGGTITAIRIQKKNKRRANLYLDGRFALGLSLEVVLDSGLRRGQVLDEADLEALRKAEKGRQAYQDALRLLSYRPRSVGEIRQRLEQKGYEEDQIEATLSRLLELKLLDDLVFARIWVENRLEFNPRGRRALSSELWKKGVPKEIVDRVLDELLPKEDEFEQALAIARKRAPSLSGLERAVFFRRMRGFLARRGFPAGIVWEVVQKAWEESQEESL
jgi:regulatory protein